MNRLGNTKRVKVGGPSVPFHPTARGRAAKANVRRRRRRKGG